MTGATQILGAILSTPRDGGAWDGIIDEAVVAAAREHEVGPLLYRALRRGPAWERQPLIVCDRLTQIAREAVLIDQLRLGGDRAVMATLAAAGLAPLIFKGTALAHRHYPEPWLRPRVDTDLLIREGDQADAAAAFERMGFTRVPRPTGDHVTHQFTYARIEHSVRFEYDVHWKIADPQVFADVLTYDEAAEDAVALPPLGESARAIGDVHALLVACTHRVAHHFDTDCLLFLNDIDILARRLDDAQWDRVVALAADKRMRRVCARGLTLAADLFATPVPSRVGSALEVGEMEPSAAHLAPRLRRVDILRSDLRALGWRGRLRLMREHLLPAPAFMLASYGKPHASLLPALYLHRIVRGAVRWFRPLRSR